MRLADCKVGLVRSVDDAHEMMTWLGSVRSPILSVDVETDGFNWYDGNLRLVQFGSTDQAWAVPYAWYPRLVEDAMLLLDERRMPLVGHNFRFDLHWLDRNLKRWTPRHWSIYHDTLNMAAVLNSSGDKTLKGLSERYVTSEAKEGQQRLKDAMKEGGWTWGTVPVELPEYWIYGGIDTILNVNLAEVLSKKMAELGTLEAYATEHGAYPTLYAMEHKGMLVDVDHCRTQIHELNGRMAEIQAQTHDYGIDNVNSGDQLIQAFLASGVELTTMTPSGKRFSMSKAAFEELEAREGKHPLVALVSEHRRSERYVSAYYENFIDYQRTDGRVHPQFRQAQARTGRMSASDPSVQNIPRHSTDPNVRNSFVAPDGHVLIATDFTNVEARIFAHFAKEQGMLDTIRAGTDLHGYTAQQVYHQWDDTGAAPKDHPLRQVAKNTLFCMLFGGGPTKVASTAHVTIEEAKDAFDGIHRAFPGIKAFQKQVEWTAKSNFETSGQAWIKGVDGRILTMAQNDDRYYAFTNWIIQGTATVLLKQRMAVIHQMGLDPYCVCAIHDEIVGEVPEDEAEPFSRAMEEAMLDEHQFSVPCSADAGAPAKRLGDAK